MSNETKRQRKPRPEWIDIVKKYQQPSPGRSTWQVVNSAIPFFSLWVLAYLSLEVSYLLTSVFCILAAGMVMRLFIIQHDCGHGSFTNSQKYNDVLGSILGVITLTPYFHWRRHHAVHHATSGDLDFRGIGDVKTRTVAEYDAMSKSKRLMYRIYRHPLVMFGLSPVFLFVVFHRLPLNLSKGDNRERASVWWTNAAVVGVVLLVSWLIGFKAFVLVQLPITGFVAVVGVYLFYVQHQYEDTYWRIHPEWDYFDAAMKGSSYFELPKILQWFSGNIGFHHIHHLSPLIPNYLLEQAHRENVLFQQVHKLTIKSSFRSAVTDLWDEKRKKLISFREYRRYYVLEAA
jgi:omega-6 fatty acid desaturase (delta-12 desaturase)